MNSSLDISKIVAGISFIIGTLFLVIHLFFKGPSIVLFGLYYVIIAFVFNTLVFLALMVRLINHSEKWSELLKAIGVILINIPIAIGYFFIVINSN